MNFNLHLGLSGKHSFLSPSQYHWINYDDQKLEARFTAAQASARGTALHELAHDCIKLRVKLAKSDKTMSMYVNDAINYKMNVEQPLYYSDNCFGTADAISFRRGTLRIHDLKTGMTKASFRQLEVYAAIFCLEYDVDPYSIRMEFRIYQNGEALIMDGDPDVIFHIMSRIIELDAKIQMMKELDD